MNTVLQQRDGAENFCFLTHQTFKARRGRRTLYGALLGTVGCAALCGPALAQKTDNQIETVVVTSEKQAEDLQKAPLAITALSATALEQNSATTFTDYVSMLPSVSYTVGGAGGGNGGPGFANVSMRGVTSGGDGNHSGSLPTVGTYLDEIPITTIGGALDIHAYDMARVEALSGPQGTLYGASSEAGTLRLITNQPDSSGFAAGYDVGITSIIDHATGGEFEGFVNVPLTDKLAVRMVAYDENDPGYINNVPGTRTYPTSGVTINNSAIAKNNFNSANSYGGRLTAKYDINDDWTVTPMLIAQVTNSSGVFAYAPSIGDLDVTHFFPEYVHDKWYQAALTIHGKIANLDVVYAGGYMERSIHAASDYTDYSFFYDSLFGSGAYVVDNAGHPINPSQHIFSSDYFSKLSNELRISTPTDRRLRFTGGVFFERQSHYILQNYQIQGIGSQIAIPGWPNTLWLTDQERVDRDSALFGEMKYDITPSLTLTAGGRVFYAANGMNGFFGLSSGFSSHTGVSQCFGPANIKGAPCANLDKTVYESGFTHKLNLSWQVNDDDMVYATWSTGFRPGGINRRSSIPPYNPDRLTNYEIGYKTSWLNNSLQLDGAIFREDWNKFQYSFLGENSFTEILNAGNARIYGAELNAIWKPYDGVTLSSNTAYTDAHLTSAYCGPVVNNVVVTQCPGPLDANGPDAPKGTAMPTTPKWKTNISARYNFPLYDVRAHVQTTLDYQSSSWPDLRLQAANPITGAMQPLRSALGQQRSFATVDLNAGFVWDNWHIDLFLKNAFDKRADLYRYAECTAQVCGGETYINTNKPRAIELRLGQDF